MITPDTTESRFQMKKIVLIVLIGLFLSCQKHNSFVANPSAKSFSLKDRLLDSLHQSSSLDELLLRDDSGRYVLYSKKINHTKMGFVAVTDSTLFFYQKNEDRWVLNDSIPFDTYACSYKVIDLNGDGKNDFVVYGFADVHGQSKPFVFICDEENVLRYREDIKLYNMTYDADSKFVRSFYGSCAYCIHSKELHKWVNDSLKLIERVELDLTNDKQIKTLYYKEVNGRLVNYKTINNESSYENALWDDSL